MVTPLHLIERPSPKPKPMLMCIAANGPDGVVFRHVNPRKRLWTESDTDCCQRMMAKLPSDWRDAVVIHVNTIPKDHSDRASWRIVDGNLVTGRR